MNTKNTFVWFVLAAGLFASILILDHYLRPPAADTRSILPGLQPSLVTSVQVIPAGAREIRADRSGGSWLLTKPVSYPAQTAAIEALLNALEKLVPVKRALLALDDFRDRRD